MQRIFQQSYINRNISHKKTYTFLFFPCHYKTIHNDVISIKVTVDYYCLIIPKAED